MIPLNITPNIDNSPWTELNGPRAYPGLGTIVRIGRLPSGTSSGKSTVSIMIEMPDGKLVAGQTTMALMVAAVRALAGADQP